MSVLFIGVLLQTPAVAQSCQELYAQRNAIFKGAGYCFGTPRGIRHFGNAGCQYDRQADVPLSDVIAIGLPLFAARSERAGVKVPTSAPARLRC
jgi:hypothetical protein